MRKMYAQSDEDWREQVKNRYEGHCAWPKCGSSYQGASHHIIRRGLLALRLLIDNGVYLCGRHHRIVEKIKGRMAYKKVMVLLIGEKKWLLLKNIERAAIRALVPKKDLLHLPSSEVQL